MAEDLERLRRLAQAANDAPLPSTERVLAWEAFEDAADPEAVLALLERLARVEAVVDRLAADDLDYDTSHGAAGQVRLLADLQAALNPEES